MLIWKNNTLQQHFLFPLLSKFISGRTRIVRILFLAIETSFHDYVFSGFRIDRSRRRYEIPTFILGRVSAW